MSTFASTPIGPAASASGAGSVSGALDNTMIASNFTTFLQLLTTQLKNQNPLDPLDTNQFTQQLVQFAQVEQQLKSYQQLETLVSMQKSAQTTQALGFVAQLLGLRLWKVECQLHVCTVARATPSNKRLQPAAAGATMGRRG